MPPSCTVIERPCRVVVVGHTSFSRSRGRARYSRRIWDQGIETHLIVPDRWYEEGRWQIVDAPDETERNIHFRPIRLPKLGEAKWYLHHYPGLQDYVSRLEPDVLHVWEEPWSLVALQAVLLRNRFAPSMPLVLEVEQNILKRLPPPFEKIRRYVLANTDYLLARSMDALNVVNLKGYAGRASLINHAVDQTIFRPRGTAEMVSRDPERGLTIGYVGRIVVEKGLDDVLDALLHCKSRIKLLIMGEGPHQASLVDRVGEVGLGDKVEFLPWASPEAVAKFLSRLDVLILMTRTTKTVKEQFGRVIIEAHSCGVPVIGSDSGSIPQVVGQGGWIVPTGDLDKLTVMLDQLATHPEQLAPVGLVGRKQVQMNFSIEVVGAALVAAWRRSLDTRSAVMQPAITIPRD